MTSRPGCTTPRDGAREGDDFIVIAESNTAAAYLEKNMAGLMQRALLKAAGGELLNLKIKVKEDG